MNIDSQIEAIEQKVRTLISTDPESFLVEVKIRPGNNIKVFIDADKGMSIEKLAQLNRSLYKQIEESGFFPNGDFSLEVSSPGLDEPLKLHRQYLKNVGRNIEVLQKDGVKKEGRLIAVADDWIVVEEEKVNKKQRTTMTHTILFDEIKTTKIQIKF